jgi:hypothetical protein
MSDSPGHTPQSQPLANYSLSIARAIEWLGDRYLLARPMNNVGHGHVSPRSSISQASMLIIDAAG